MDIFTPREHDEILLYNSGYNKRANRESCFFGPSIRPIKYLSRKILISEEEGWKVLH